MVKVVAEDVVRFTGCFFYGREMLRCIHLALQMFNICTVRTLVVKGFFVVSAYSMHVFGSA